MMTGRAIPGHGSHVWFTHAGVMHAHTRVVLSHHMKAWMVLRLSVATELLAGTALIFVPGALVTALIGVSSTPVDDVLGPGARSSTARARRNGHARTRAESWSTSRPRIRDVRRCRRSVSRGPT